MFWGFWICWVSGVSVVSGFLDIWGFWISRFFMVSRHFGIGFLDSCVVGGSGFLGSLDVM